MSHEKNLAEKKNGRKKSRRKVEVTQKNYIIIQDIFFLYNVKFTKVKQRRVTDDDPFMGVTSRQSLPQLSIYKRISCNTGYNINTIEYQDINHRQKRVTYEGMH